MRCEAYQLDRTVAHCVATFMRMGKKGIPSLDVMTNNITLHQASANNTVKTVEVDFKDVVDRVRAEQSFAELANVIPYAKLIGVEFDQQGEKLSFKLKQRPSNLGNPILPAIHGGVLGGFMELSSALHLLVSQSTLKFPKIIDFSIDYLRTGRNVDTYAECEVTRQGGRVANVELHAWQDNKKEPIALARAHFLLED